MVGKGERVDLDMYISIVVCLGRLGESATYPDDQRRLGFVEKGSIRSHGVVCVVV